MSETTSPTWADVARAALADARNADLHAKYEGYELDLAALAELFRRLGLPLDATNHPTYANAPCSLVPKGAGCHGYRPIYAFYADIDPRPYTRLRRLRCVKTCCNGLSEGSRSRFIDSAADLGRLLDECPEW